LLLFQHLADLDCCRLLAYMGLYDDVAAANVKLFHDSLQLHGGKAYIHWMFQRLGTGHFIRNQDNWHTERYWRL